MDFRFTLAGFLVGSLIGATGVGGGSLMTPILMMVFRIPAGVAVGTDLLFAAVTKGVGTGLHGLNQSVSWKVVGRLAVGSVPASVGMLVLMHTLFDPSQVAGVITKTLGVALVLTSLAILLQKPLRRLFGNGEAKQSERPEAGADPEAQKLMFEAEAACEARPQSVLPTIFTGFVLGTFVTITSVGAGALGVMVLMSLYPKVRSVRIVGTDIAHAVPLTLVAGMGHASMGAVDFSLLGSLLLGSIPGIAMGSHIAFRLPEKVMKHILAVILILVGSKLLLSA